MNIFSHHVSSPSQRRESAVPGVSPGRGLLIPIRPAIYTRGNESISGLAENRGDFGRRCAKIVRARRLFPANFAFRCFANNNFKDVKFSAL